MKEFLEETKCVKYRADDIDSLHLTCKNYHVRISQGTEPEIIIRFHNNCFRKMNVSKNGSGIYNPNAKRKIILRSNMYVPELDFTK